MCHHLYLWRGQMPIYEFKKCLKKDEFNNSTDTTVLIQIETVSKEEIKQTFRDFLKACGFHVDDDEDLSAL